jgi:hypothetical protein
MHQLMYEIGEMNGDITELRHDYLFGNVYVSEWCGGVWVFRKT